MSLGDEPVSNQHGSTTNNVMSAQRPINCLPVPPPVSPTVKQTSINSPLASGNRILMKSNTVPSRSKVDRTLSKQESAETDGGITPTSQRSRVIVALLFRPINPRPVMDREIFKTIDNSLLITNVYIYILYSAIVISIVGQP